MRKIDLSKMPGLRQMLAALAILVVGLALPTRGHAREPFDLDVANVAFISRGSCLHAKMAQPGEALFSVNDWPIPTYPVDGQFKTDENGDEHNLYRATFDSVLFRPGSNRIDFGWASAGGDQTCVDVAESVTLSSASFGARQIFYVVQQGQAFSGATTVDFSLMDLDPALAMSIANLEQVVRDERARLIADAGRIAKRDAEIAKKLDVLSSLDKDLKALANQGFDEISAAELSAIFARYPDLPSDGQQALVQLVDDLHKGVDDLHQEVTRLMDDFAAQADAATVVVTGDVRKAGWTPEDAGNYVPAIYGADIPAVATPDLGSQSTFDGADDPYDRYAISIVDELNDTLEGGKVADKAEFAAIVRSWRKNQDAVDRIIRERATVNAAETQAFLKAQSKVLTLVRRYMGADDWFNDAPVSPELKRLLDGAIRQNFAQIASTIKDGMNQWTKRGPGEEMLEEVTIGMGSVAENGYAEQPDEVKGVVTRVLGWVGTAATIGVGFTPVGDVLDACEAITGRALCKPSGAQLATWERVAAGLGVVLGSGTFWKVVGASVVGTKVASAQILAVISWTNSKGRPGRLASIGPGKWRSSAGLVYDQGSVHGNRVKHVLAHTLPDTTKRTHSVFVGGRASVLPALDEAWSARGKGVVQGNGNTLYHVAIGRVVGTGGETAIDIVIKKGTTSDIVTAFPSF